MIERRESLSCSIYRLEPNGCLQVQEGNVSSLDAERVSPGFPGSTWGAPRESVVSIERGSMLLAGEVDLPRTGRLRRRLWGALSKCLKHGRAEYNRLPCPEGSSRQHVGSPRPALAPRHLAPRKSGMAAQPGSGSRTDEAPLSDSQPPATPLWKLPRSFAKLCAHVKRTPSSKKRQEEAPQVQGREARGEKREKTGRQVVSPRLSHSHFHSPTALRLHAPVERRCEA